MKNAREYLNMKRGKQLGTIGNNGMKYMAADSGKAQELLYLNGVHIMVREFLQQNLIMGNLQSTSEIQSQVPSTVINDFDELISNCIGEISFEKVQKQHPRRVNKNHGYSGLYYV